MSKKKKKRGIRTYRPHGVATIIYAFFGLVAIAALAGFALLPMFSFVKEGEVLFTFTGLDFFEYGIKRFVPAFSNPNFAQFESYYAHAEPSNELLKIIINFHGYIELATAAFIGLAVFWGVIELVLVAIFLIMGRSNHPKGVSLIAWLEFWAFAIHVGLAFMYFFFYMQIIESTGEVININLSIYALAILGGLLFVCLILSLMHMACFKDRVALDRSKMKAKSRKEKKAKKDEDEDDDDEEEEEEAPEQIESNADETQSVPPVEEASKPAEAPVLEPKKENSPKPNDVITVGDRAYAKNTDLTSATIPEGIVSLGSSAFANCVNLKTVSIPSTIQEIGFNCFFNTPQLETINYNGPIEHWKLIKRGSNWLTKSGTTTVHCTNGQINVNPRH